MRIIDLKVTAVFDDETTATITWDLLSRELDKLDFQTLADERVRLDTLIKTLRLLNLRICKQRTNPAKADVKRHGRARAKNFRNEARPTTKHSKTGSQGVERTGVYIGSGERGSGFFRAKQPHKGTSENCKHFIPSGAWFWTDPVTSDIYCVGCAPKGSQ